MKISDQKIKNYIDVLSSNASMPGGGTVSAIAGAEGISLILMVCNLTKGKEKYKKYQKLIAETIKESEKIKERFLYLAEKDTVVFKNIEKVFKMPKNTEKEKEKRKKAMESACKKCCKVPEEIIDLSLRSLEKAEKIIGKSNISAVSDIAVGAINLSVAAKGAWFNILINLKSIKDKKFINKYQKIKKAKLKKIEKIEKIISKKTGKLLNG